VRVEPAAGEQARVGADLRHAPLVEHDRGIGDPELPRLPARRQGRGSPIRWGRTLATRGDAGTSLSGLGDSLARPFPAGRGCL
jgi:hypothetical protein